jgi:hypothetical protein
MASLDIERLLKDLAAQIQEGNALAEATREDAASYPEDPYARRRWVSNLSTLRELSPQDPGRPFLASWVLWMLLGRLGHECARAEATARQRKGVRVALPRPVELSLREGVKRLVEARTAGERAAVAEALEQADAGASDAALELWMRRGEALRRAGGEELEPLLQPLPSFAALRLQAERLLDETEELAQTTLGRPKRWQEGLALGVGQQGDVPWPRRLSARWLLGSFEGEAGWLEVPGLRLGSLPELLGGSSVLRALARFGARWADAARSRTLPAALAQLPTGLQRYRSGARMASLLQQPIFLQRGLGMSRPEALRARRQQGHVALAAVRLEAARTLLWLTALRGDRREARQLAVELMRRLWGAPIPGALALALPRIHATSPGRLLGMALGAADARWLRERHDEDWYRNPGAALALRDQHDRAPEPTLSEETASQARGVLIQSLEDTVA